MTARGWRERGVREGKGGKGVMEEEENTKEKFFQGESNILVRVSLILSGPLVEHALSRSHATLLSI